MFSSRQAFARSVYYRKQAEATPDDGAAARLFGVANLFLKMSQDLYRVESGLVAQTQVCKSSSAKMKYADFRFVDLGLSLLNCVGLIPSSFVVTGIVNLTSNRRLFDVTVK